MLARKRGFSYNTATGVFSLTFNSTLGETYTIKAGTDLVTFPIVVTDNIPGDGSPVTVPFTNPMPGAPRMFFRVEVK